MNLVNPWLIQAIRGPVLLIVLGVLLAMDHAGVVEFRRVWPVLVILYGVLKLAERTGVRAAAPAGSVPRER
jgi:hypothetical protein